MAASNNVSQTTQRGRPGNSGISPTSPEETKDDYEPKGNRYFGALVLVAAIIPLPFLAALITIIAYLSTSPLPAVAFFNWLGPSNMVIILLGLIITLVLWLLLAIPCKYFATAEGGRPSDYANLQSTYNVLKKRLEVVNSEQATLDAANTATPTVQYKVAIADIESNLENYIDMLNRNGLPWVLYTGYVGIWDRINIVDEAMIGVLPRETVIEGANYDELSLQDSDVPESQDLFNLLHNAIDTLSSDSTSPSAANNWHVFQPSEQEARADIRKVKSVLHKFTNERWIGLVRARNQLMGTAFLTALFTYILVVIAILAYIPPKITLEAMVFYFLGAIVGLFGRLFDERNADKIIDDYGLSTMRIIVTPLLSGLATLVGILLLTSAQATIYNFSLLNLYFATILGYAPNLLINTLQSKSEEIKGQIKSASPSGLEIGSATIYELDLNQARRWSRISITSATLGILLIIGGVITIFTGYTIAGLVISIAGSISEITAVLTSQQAKQADRQVDSRSEQLLEPETIKQALSSGDAALKEEIDFNPKSLSESYKNSQFQSHLLFWVWLTSIVLTVLLVLGGVVALLAASIIGIIFVVNPVTSSLIIALMGIVTGSVSVALRGEMKRNDKRMDELRTKLYKLEPSESTSASVKKPKKS